MPLKGTHGGHDESTGCVGICIRVWGSADSGLNELYGRYTTRVLAVVRARLGAELRQRVQSLDIVQEATLDSLKNLDKFDYASEGTFLKWLTAIVENRIRDQRDFHKAARRDMGKQSPLENPRSDGSAIPLEMPDKSGLPTASRAMMLTEDMLRLEQALDHLPAETRELIIAVKLDGRTYQELADETGKTSDAVRMQANRAMDALHDEMLWRDGSAEADGWKPTATFGGRSAIKDKNQRVTRPRVPHSRARIRGREAVRRGVRVNFLVAEVARLQNSPEKLNSGEFSSPKIHSLGVTGLLYFPLRRFSTALIIAPHSERAAVKSFAVRFVPLR